MRRWWRHQLARRKEGRQFERCCLILPANGSARSLCSRHKRPLRLSRKLSFHISSHPRLNPRGKDNPSFIGRGKSEALLKGHLPVSVLRTHLLPSILDLHRRQVTADDGGFIAEFPLRMVYPRTVTEASSFSLTVYPLASSAAVYLSQEKADIPARTARQSFLMRALFSSNLSSVRFQPRRRLISSAAVLARMPIRWSLFRQLSISTRLQSRWR